MTSEQSTNPPAADVTTLSFEAAQAELERIVEQLESPGTGLEQALTLWERGEQLHAHCKSRLDAALARIERIELSAAEVQAVAEEGSADSFEPAPANTGAANGGTAPTRDTPANQPVVDEAGPLPIF